MGRIQCKRIQANTNIISRLDSNYTRRENPCTFNGIMIRPIAKGSAAAGTVTVYSDNNDDLILPRVNIVASANTITISSGPVTTFDGLGLHVGDLITLSGAANAGNNRQHKITNITSTVITTDSCTDDESDRPVELQKNNIIWRMEYHYEGDPDAESGMLLYESLFTNGIFCPTGLRVESSSWTNIECFVLHS